MSATASVQPDGSVVVVDGQTTYPPLSPEAVQAIAAQAEASANATNTQAVAASVAALADLITAAAPSAGASAYAQVTVTPGQVVAVLDESSYALVTGSMRGKSDGAGGWIAGPVKVSPKAASPTPAPTEVTP